ncbi:hypothetical protein [Longispora albida]|uniref:hypothetical protein n=1 Tax=Longispora albida TaxID=203523 RepID=UPI00037D26BE|nr:hypothetical protein [Longispora albida]
MQRLSPAGRRTRLAATGAGAALLLLGSLLGQDDAFPFGPMRMYATTDRLDAPIRDTRVEAVDAAGRAVTLTERNTGFRRAEVEGQLGRNTAMLPALAEAYARRQPGEPSLDRISVVVRWHELRGGRPTGQYREETVVTWSGR